MSICTNFLSSSHQLNVIDHFKKETELPFSQILSKEEIIGVLGREEKGNRFYGSCVTIWAFLSQVLEEDKSQQAAVIRIISTLIKENKKAPSPNTSAYSQARSRLPESCLVDLTCKVAKDIEKCRTQEQLWRGRRVKLVDGSSVSMPDTFENQQEYPQSTRQKSGLGFPAIRIVGLIDYFTGVVCDIAMKAAYGGEQTGEHALLRELMASLDHNDLLIGDCYYPSFFLMATLIKHNIAGVFPQHGSRSTDFRRGKSLGKKDHLTTWMRPKKPDWMTQEEYESIPEKITVREIEVQIKRPGFRDKKRIIVTTFLDHSEATADDLMTLYGYRWFIELTFYSIKETLQMGILRGKTPSMVRKEIWAHLLAYNLIRRVMLKAARLYGFQISQLSFKLALQTLKTFLQAGLDIFDPLNIQAIFKIITYKNIANRPNRNEPRCVKRRPKRFPRMQKNRSLYKNAA